jgi:hypothetical protein
MQFTYTFPPLLALGYVIKKNAICKMARGFDPATGRVTRHDAGFKRWTRGFMKGKLVSEYLETYCICSVLWRRLGWGAYSAVEALIAAFAVCTRDECVHMSFSARQLPVEYVGGSRVGAEVVWSKNRALYSLKISHV